MRLELTEWLNILSDQRVFTEVELYQPLYEIMKQSCERMLENKEILYIEPTQQRPKDQLTTYTYRSSCLVNFLDEVQKVPRILENNKEVCKSVLPRTEELIKQIRYITQTQEQHQEWHQIIKQKLDQYCCHYSCKTCNGSEANQCTSCSADCFRELSSNHICVPIEGHYDDTKHCRAPDCHHACKTCNEKSNEDCIECNVDRDYSRNCDCVHGLYEQGVVCVQCHYTCGSCDGPSENQCTNDLPCPNGRHFDNDRCIPDEGTYPIVNEPETRNCHYSCQNCTGPNRNECNECWEEERNKPSDKHRILSNDNQCLCKASPGFTLDFDQQPVCQQCHANCVTCSGPGPEDCTDEGECLENMHFEQNKCVANCGFYITQNQVPIVAKPCHYSCGGCNGPLSTECTFCTTFLGRVFEKIENHLGKCVCKAGIDDGQNQECSKQCHYSCSIHCVGSNVNQCQNNCVHNRIYDNGYCRPADNYYDDGFNTAPKKCNQECQTCDGSGNSNCLTCNGKGRQISRTEKNHFRGNCICGQSLFERANEWQADCLPCGIGVKSCTFLEPVGIVPLECFELREIVNNQCYCSQGFYSREDQNLCQKCQLPCENCLNLDVQCTSCTGKNRSIVENTCPCEEGYYSDANNKCVQCHPTCKYCTGNGVRDCTVTKSPLCEVPENYNNDVHIDFIIDNSTFMLTQYIDTIEPHTKKLDLLRFALSRFIIGRTQYNWELGYFDKMTLFNCDSTGSASFTNEDLNNQLIEKMPINFRREAQVDQALTSYLNYLEKDETNNEKHILTIVLGQSTQLPKEQLELLNRQVHKISKINIIQLQEEQSELAKRLIELFPNKAKAWNFIQPQQYVDWFWAYSQQQTTAGFAAKCKLGYYANLDWYNTPADVSREFCQQCHYYCLSCDGPNFNNCTSCNDDHNRVLKAKECVPKEGYQNVDGTPVAALKCRINEYRNSRNECKTCDDSCTSCQGPLITDCLDCPVGTFLTIQDENGDTTCDPCHITCSTCKGINSDDCQSCDSLLQKRELKQSVCQCIEGYEESTGQICHKICQISEYREDNNTCNKCHYSCQSCNGPDNISCLSCNPISKRILNDGQCKPIEGYVDTGVQIAEKCEPYCKECSLQPENCTSCRVDWFQYNNKCYCRSGNYENALNQCVQCQDQCLACSNSTRCTQCHINANLTQEGDCQCDSSFVQTTNGCIACHVTCETCRGTEENHCTKCFKISNRKLINGRCIPEVGYYEITVPNVHLIARKCHDSCITCNGPDENYCLSCGENKHLEKSENSSKCVANQSYYQNQGGSAINCHYSCKACDGAGPSACTECVTIRQPLIQKTCQCNKFYFDDASNRDNDYCSQCHFSCLTCFDDKYDTCLTCSDQLNQSLRIFNQNQCECPKSYYYSELNEFICKKCHYSCKNCVLNDKEPKHHCTECGPKRQLSKKNECLPIPNFYDLQNEHIPQPCHFTCFNCFGPQRAECTYCNDEFNRELKGNECVPKQGFYEKEKSVCPPCSVQCKSCTDNRLQGFSFCTVPAENYQFVNPERHPGLVEPKPGFYHTPEGAKSCNQSCHTCSGPEEGDCESCHNNFYLNNGFCKTIDGYYPDLTYPSNALPCHKNCKTCDGPNKNNCTSCNLLKHRELNIKNNCVCQQRFYEQGEKCLRCHYSCRLCNGPMVTECEKCDIKDYREMSLNQECKPITGFYECNTQESCKCHEACKNCTGNTDKDCIEPNPGYQCEHGRCTPICGNNCTKCTVNVCLVCTVNTELNEDTGVCDAKPGFYKEIPSNVVKKCDIACYSCTEIGNANCIECADNYFKEQDKCVELSCYPLCKSCVANGPSNCTSCKVNLSITEGKCNPDEGYFVDDPEVGAETCHITCKTCIQREDNKCESCRKHMILTEDNKCVTDESFYFKEQPPGAKPCSKLCKNCTGPLSNDCTECYEDGTLIGDINAKTCLYPENNIRYCIKVNKTNNNVCIHCESHTTLNQQTGHCDIDVGFFPDPTNPVIIRQCNSTCQACNNRGPSNCTSCPDGRYLQDSECLQCYVSCQSCSGPSQTQCIQCRLNTRRQQNVCVPNPGFYFDPTDPQNIVKECSNSCLQCKGGQSNECSTCRQNFTLVNGVCKVNDGFYIDGEEEIPEAHQCHFTCKTCNGKRERNCTSCRTRMTLKANGKCKPDDGTYLPEGTEVVENCHISCRQCTGISSDQCLKCYEQFTLTQKNTCVINEGFQPDPTDPTKPKPCSIGCRQCLNQHSCQNCFNNFTLINGQCQINQGYIIDTSDLQNPAKECHNTCKTCNGEGEQACTSCREHFTYNKRNNSCQIEQGYTFDPYQSPAIAEKCHNKCKDCTAPGENNCTKCNLHAYLINGNCLCNDGFVFDNNECINNPGTYNCNIAACHECLNSDQCNVCNNNFSLNNNQCQPNEGYFVNPEDPNNASKCHESCKTCTGGQIDQCVTCSINIVLTQENKCVNLEGSIQFNDNVTQEGSIKFSCNISGCEACTNPCRVCKQNFVLSQNLCKPAEGYYVDPNNQDNVKKCHQTCKTCNGPHNSNCLSCNLTSQQLVNAQCVELSGSIRLQAFKDIEGSIRFTSDKQNGSIRITKINTTENNLNGSIRLTNNNSNEGSVRFQIQKSSIGPINDNSTEGSVQRSGSIGPTNDNSTEGSVNLQNQYSSIGPINDNSTEASVSHQKQNSSIGPINDNSTEASVSLQNQYSSIGPINDISNEGSISNQYQNGSLSLTNNYATQRSVNFQNQNGSLNLTNDNPIVRSVSIQNQNSLHGNII